MSQIIDCGCPGCSLWLRLEAEKRDLSYLDWSLKSNRDNNSYRDEVFFHAGRYRAGDRDNLAKQANRELATLKQNQAAKTKK